MTETGPLRFLVATDGSRAAVAATRCALTLARSCGGEVLVVAVGGGADGTRGPVRGTGDMERSLAHAVRSGAEVGVPTASELIDPAGRDTWEAIRAAATAWGADLLFVGRTGRHGPGRAMMGSQAEHVLEFSDVPVVVVPPGRGREP